MDTQRSQVVGGIENFGFTEKERLLSVSLFLPSMF